METLIKQNDLMIPVDESIEKFKAHLMACPRTVLSARFGDGKTYFVDKFIHDEDVKKSFLCLKLYPVNYQVVGNNDIFELIKRDILVQMLFEEVIEEDIHIDGNVIASFFLQYGKQDLLTTLVEFMAPLATASNEMSTIFGVLGGLRILQFMTSKYETFKKKQLKGEVVKQFIESQDEKTSYEPDAVTRIIREALMAYRERHKKRVVLFIEDMDRLDPAHLFRIMNVLSAHMDYEYKRNRPDIKQEYSNKFGLDNIVLVMDYKNTEKIFHHFYGQDTDYRGYIDKFCAGGYFNYSLAEEKNNFIYQQVAMQVKLPLQSIKLLLPKQYFDGKTIREIREALNDVDSMLIEKPYYVKGDKKIPLHLGLLRLLVVYRKLGAKENEIAHIMFRVSRSDVSTLLDYMGGYILLRDGSNADVYLFSRIEGGKSMNHIVLKDVKEDGLALFQVTMETDTNKKRFDISAMIHYLYDRYIVPIVIESF